MLPRLLHISHVAPFPGHAGQQQRVRYKLRALRSAFHITALSFAVPGREDVIAKHWRDHVDDVIILPSIVQRNQASRVFHKAAAIVYAAVTGLRQSNYVIGNVELSPRRVKEALRERSFDLALFEYWHSHASVAAVRAAGIPSVLDMHDIIWQARARQLEWRCCAGLRVRRYREREEAAWREYDALIAINGKEEEYVRAAIPGMPVFLAPMGTDLAAWPNRFEPAAPPRIGFYGSMGSAVNRDSALRCVRSIMPIVWERRPDAQFWIIGANPNEELLALQKDRRITVTDYIPDPGIILGSLTAVLCPWNGTYGFRSRLVEVMATGVPVVASPDAVHGMNAAIGEGLLLDEDDAGLARHCLDLIVDAQYLNEQSTLARRQAEQRFGFESTYGTLAGELLSLVKSSPPNKEGGRL
jgi:glycosyltransferase involved in cell wall biosynthesis